MRIDTWDALDDLASDAGSASPAISAAGLQMGQEPVDGHRQRRVRADRGSGVHHARNPTRTNSR
jgi:hypothetical protein